MLIRPFLTPLHEGPDRRGRGVKNSHTILLAQVPESVLLGPVGSALVHEDRGTVGQGPVNDVAVSRDPSNVGGAPIDVVVPQIEDALRRRGNLSQIPTGRVHHALGLSGRPGRVKDVQQIFGIHDLRSTISASVGKELVIPVITAFSHVRVDLGGEVHPSRHHHHVFDRRAGLQRLIGVPLEGDDPPSPVSAVRCDQHLRTNIVDTISERFRTESTENHRMGSADARASEHRDRGFRNHGQVDGHAIPLPYAQVLQRIGELAHLAMEPLVCVLSDITGLSLPDQRRLVPARAVQVPIQTIVGDVELSPDEPLGVRGVPFEHRMPAFEPVQFLRPRFPKGQAVR